MEIIIGGNYHQWKLSSMEIIINGNYHRWKLSSIIIKKKIKHDNIVYPKRSPN
ncbi:hypothetical protein [Acanthamoeba polyphaga mimivirus]|nr:orphan [Mimivirus reunion]UMZ07538.1 hypothetical protein [Acanthamoeba polyphaga mimivirus]WMV62295.1 orphan [Mimivirus sp.]UTE96735.1 putative Fe2OG oxygenase family oxidoreductase MIMI-L905 [Acanthamoeba polyphaga mimivirus]WMV63272.1 orphan [Acanthamoeba polyphaga mimivirus]